MRRDKGENGKKVSTSELIDWFHVLSDYPHDQILAALNGKLVFPSVLLKSWPDHQRYLKEQSSSVNADEHAKRVS
jgi:hypothetical protein